MTTQAQQCPACSSTSHRPSLWNGTVECTNCKYIFELKKRVRVDEFGDEIDYNERKADWAW